MTNSKKSNPSVELPFNLLVENECPPVSVEHLPCIVVGKSYRVENPPLFLKHLSVGDVISVVRADNGNVASWSHISMSKNTTIWLLQTAKTEGLAEALSKLRSLGCHTVQLPEYGCYSIDVPEICAINDVDECLSRLDTTTLAIAYPSFRHSDGK